MNSLRYISDDIGHVLQLLEYPRWDLLRCACIIIAAVYYVYLTGPKAQTKVLVLSVFLAGACLVNPLLYAGANIDHVFELLEHPDRRPAPVDNQSENDVAEAVFLRQEWDQRLI